MEVLASIGLIRSFASQCAFQLAHLPPPLQAYYKVFSSDKRSWEQLGAVWSTAARMTSKVYRSGEAPDFLKLMDGSVAQLARKPVHARSPSHPARLLHPQQMHSVLGLLESQGQTQ